ncbi:MAG: hypothetical protein ACRDWE_11095, partial [Acidimicrobiales bacterium]
MDRDDRGVSALLALQRSLGNRAVSRLVAERSTAQSSNTSVPPVAVARMQLSQALPSLPVVVQRNPPHARSSERSAFTATHGSGYAPALDDHGNFVDEDVQFLEKQTRK